MIRQGRVVTPRFTVDGQTAVVKRCPTCEMDTPHRLTDAGSMCGVCGREQMRQAAGPRRRETGDADPRVHR